MVVEAKKHGQETTTVVLCSGGVDSVVLVAHEARTSIVQPIYVSAGLAWETVERAALATVLAAPVFAGLRPLMTLDGRVTDLYPASHWALRGRPPAYDTDDRDVYLVGRNILLLSKAAIYCALHGISRISLGPLRGNPFPDAAPSFFEAMGGALSDGLDHPLEILAPFLGLSKADVVRLGADLDVPLSHTMSCLSPLDRSHCGRCSKCRERLQAFHRAGFDDPAPYAYRPNNLDTG